MKRAKVKEPLKLSGTANDLTHTPTQIKILIPSTIPGIPVPADEGLSPSGAHVSGQHLKRGGLPCSVNPQQAEAFSRTHPQTQAVHGQDAAHLPGLIHLTGSETTISFYKTRQEKGLFISYETGILVDTRSHRLDLGEVFYLQHVTVGVPPQHPSSLSGHVHVVIVHRLAADRDPPAEGRVELSETLYLTLHSPFRTLPAYTDTPQ